MNMRNVWSACLLLFVLSLSAAAQTQLKSYHEGPWETSIGYSQATIVGDRIYVSGTVGADAKGFPKDLQAQLKLAYAALDKTLRANGSDLRRVVVERIYTTDIEALKRSETLRKAIYGGHAPAATWVEVRRLYESEALIEIELEAIVANDEKKTASNDETTKGAK